MTGRLRRLRQRLWPPMSYQLDGMDCGPSCLHIIAQFHELALSKHAIRSICDQDRNGITLSGLAKAARHLGFRTLAVRVSLSDLCSRAPLPCIAHFVHGHFVVVQRANGSGFAVLDPAAGPTWYSKAEFARCWLNSSDASAKGVLLLCELEHRATSTIRPASKAVRMGLRRAVWEGVRRHAGLLALSFLIIMLAQFTLPFLNAALVNIGIKSDRSHLVYLLIVGQAALIVSILISTLFQGWVVAYVGMLLDMTLMLQLLAKMMKLPMSFFDGRLTGDLVQRLNDHKQIQLFVSNGLLQVIFASLSITIFGTVLLIVSKTVFVVYLIGSTTYIGYCAIFTRRFRVLGNKQFRLAAMKQALIFDLFSGMQDIKLNNAEEHRRSEWESAQVELSKVEMSASVIRQLHSGGASAINDLKTLIITLLSVLAVMRGSMSLGSMIAVQFIVGQLSWPLNQIADLMARSHEAALSVERAKEIHLLQDDDVSGLMSIAPAYSDISLRNVGFCYSGSNPRQLFGGLNLTIRQGTTTAIVGPSGSGKTTLLKILLKYYPITDGIIAVGNVNLNDISPRSWRSQCGIVMQDGHIFTDSVISNIAMCDTHTNKSRVFEVAKIARLDEFIGSLPRGFETRIGRDGLPISKGQAQRILIARALYKDPNYLFLDEATSAMDSMLERSIVKNLIDARLGKTVIVVAHRLSTVMHADQIVVIDDGRLVEAGSHDQLLKEKGTYYQLVEHQLGLAG